jgi:hypothetical protein
MTEEAQPSRASAIAITTSNFGIEPVGTASPSQLARKFLCRPHAGQTGFPAGRLERRAG